MPAPNILWIVTTQWRAQALGYAGDPHARTPALDRLAARSVNYAQAVTPHPFGPFARAALLTGVRSPENGIRDYFDPLPTSARTVAHALREQGYRTAFFGKWHLGKRDPRAPLVGEAHARTIVPPEARGGFEFWEGFESGFLLNGPWLHGTRLPEPRAFPGYQAEVLVERAGAWWTHTTGRQGEVEGASPLFVVVSLETPHPPYDAPAAGVLARPVVVPANVPANAVEKAARELAGYYAHIEATDRALGRLLELVGDETVVVFTSVHGDMHGAHGLFRKGWPYEESVRVPLLIRSPGERGRVSMEAVSLEDLPRLMLERVAGGPAHPARHAARISMPSVVNLPWQCERTWRGVRTARHKLILNEDGSPWLFFDLEHDPGEMTNLASSPDASHQAEQATLRALV